MFNLLFHGKNMFVVYCNRFTKKFQFLAIRVVESEVKYPTPTPTFPKFQIPISELPKFPTLTPWHKGNEIWLLKSMEIMVNSKKFLFQQKFQKKLYHFNRNFQF